MAPWWQGLDLRVLRHVRGVLRRRDLELTLVEHKPQERCAFAALAPGEPTGAGLAVLAPALSAPELALIESMLGEAALDVATVLREREEPSPNRRGYAGIIGGSPPMLEMYGLLDKIAPSDTTVLIQGENGTGKELVARAIHDRSERRDHAFVVTNCSAFNDNLLDSELFGHKRGSFTGAVADKTGLFETADLGTFFLDEIGDMSPMLQVKVLRVLQEGTFNRVGDTETRKVDVRIIAASHKDLATMVANKQFREDLFYRVNVLKITVPPLRERVADIPRLAAHFVAKHWRAEGSAPKLSEQALARLVAYAWPGNIRELENEIERMLVLAGDATELTGPMVSSRVAGTGAYAGRALRDIVSVTEADAIVASLGRHNGDRDAAAAELNISRSYLDARSAALGLR
jgi:transcriptional regulator with PAS, ATPase and Fis domain